MEIGGIIKKTTKNKVLLLAIKIIEKTFVAFQQWLWKYVEVEPWKPWWTTPPIDDGSLELFPGVVSNRGDGKAPTDPYP
jgi:hypothetical protein